MTKIRTDFIPEAELDEYYAGTLTEEPALSQSVGIKMLRSARHGYAAHPRLGGRPRKPTAVMTLGNIFDELVLKGSSRIAVCDVAHNKTGEIVTDFKTNEAKAWRDSALAAGKLPITAEKSTELKLVASSVVSELDTHGVALDGVPQSCLLWGERASNGNMVQCCALLDMFWPLKALIRDFKTSDDCRPERLGNKVHALGYHVQAAAYLRGAAAVMPALAGRLTFENVWMETEYPHVPFVSEMDGQTLEVGNVLWQKALDRWEECTRTGVWPGYVRQGETPRITLPAYALTDLYGEDSDGAA